MATGDSTNFLARLKDLLPPGWWSKNDAPLRDAVLGGIADDFSSLFALIKAGKATTRIATTTGWILDLVSLDFFGLNLPRLAGEPDDSFRARIIAEVLRQRATRAGLTGALVTLTGQTPLIFEPAEAADCGGGYSIGPALGYGVAGAYGSLAYPNQVFITAYRTQLLSLTGYGGYGIAGGYSIGAMGYASLAAVEGTVTDNDIYAAVARNKASGVTAWVAIEGGVGATGGPDFFFFNN